MSDQDPVWYYTQNSERKGPVSLAEMRSMLEVGKLKLHRDLVWGPGLGDWVKASEVAELQVAAAAKVKKHISPSPPSVSDPVPAVRSADVAKENPYESPATIDDDNELADAMAARRATLAAKGVGRVAYWIGPSIIILVAMVIMMVTNVIGQSSESRAVSAIGMVIVFVFAFGGVLYFSFGRLKNLGMSGFYLLLTFVPLLNIWLNYRLYVCPAGYHQHKKLDAAGKVLAVLFVLLFGGAMVMSVLGQL